MAEAAGQGNDDDDRDLVGSLVSLSCLYPFDLSDEDSYAEDFESFYTGKVESKTRHLCMVKDESDGIPSYEHHGIPSYENVFLVKFEVPYPDNIFTFIKLMKRDEILRSRVPECPVKLLQKHVGVDGTSSDPVDWDKFYEDLQRVPTLAKVTLPLPRPHDRLQTLYWVLTRPGCRPDIVAKILESEEEWLEWSDREIFFECLFRPVGPKHIATIDPKCLRLVVETKSDVRKRLLSCIYDFLNIDSDKDTRRRSDFSNALLTPQAEVYLTASWEACVLLLQNNYDGTHPLSEVIVDFCLLRLPEKDCFFHKGYRYGTLATTMSKHLTRENLPIFRKYISTFIRLPGDSPELLKKIESYNTREFMGSVLVFKAYSTRHTILSGEEWETLVEVCRDEIRNAPKDLCRLACKLGYGWDPYLQDIIGIKPASILEEPDPVEGLPPFAFSATCGWTDYERENPEYSTDPRVRLANRRNPYRHLGQEKKRDKGILERTYNLLRANPSVLEKTHDIATNYFETKRAELVEKNVSSMEHQSKKQKTA